MRKLLKRLDGWLRAKAINRWRLITPERAVENMMLATTWQNAEIQRLRDTIRRELDERVMVRSDWHSFSGGHRIVQVQVDVDSLDSMNHVQYLVQHVEHQIVAEMAKTNRTRRP